VNTVIMFSGSDAAWSPYEWVLALPSLSSASVSGSAVATTCRGWIRVTRDPEVWHDYDYEEKRFIETLLASPCLYVVEWGDLALMDLLEAIPCDQTIIIDNDHGWIGDAREVIGRDLASWVRRPRLA
jgi:hypothetical protein